MVRVAQTLQFGWKFDLNWEDKNLSENLLAEIEIHKIDSCL
jgi:hypothetical protein